MARRGKQDDEEVTEGIDAPLEEEGSPAGAEFVPEATHRAKSDVYSAMLILTFLVFLAGTILAGREAWEHYDIQFYMFNKQGKPATAESTETAAPAPAPAPAPEPAPK